METSERSSRVGGVERGRKDRAERAVRVLYTTAKMQKRVARQNNIGRRNRKKGAESGDEGKTNGGSGAGWGAGGGLTVNLKLGCEGRNQNQLSSQFRATNQMSIIEYWKVHKVSASFYPRRSVSVGIRFSLKREEDEN